MDNEFNNTEPTEEQPKKSWLNWDSLQWIVIVFLSVIIIAVLVKSFIGKGEEVSTQPTETEQTDGGEDNSTEPETDVSQDTEPENTEKDTTEDTSEPVGTEPDGNDTQKPDEPDNGDNTGNNNGGTGNQKPEPAPEPKPQPTYTYKELNLTMYATKDVNVRELPTGDGKKAGSLKLGDEVQVTGKCVETGWYRFNRNGKAVYVSNNYLSEDKPQKGELPPQYSYEDTDGDGYANLPEYTQMGDMLVRTVWIKPDYAKFKKKLSEAGLNRVMQFEGDGFYYCLTLSVYGGEDCIEAYLNEQGLCIKTGVSGGYWGSLNGKDVFFTMVEQVWTLEEGMDEPLPEYDDDGNPTGAYKEWLDKQNK